MVTISIPLGEWGVYQLFMGDVGHLSCNIRLNFRFYYPIDIRGGLF